MPLMNPHSRIPVCGMISWYNAGALGGTLAEGPNIMPKMWRTILVNRIAVRGFIIFDHYDHFPAFIEEVGPYIRDGKVVYKETVAEGLENAPEAFINLLRGGNFGKQLVSISPDPTL